MPLFEIQQILQRLYEIETAHDVTDYLITDRSVVAALENPDEARDIQEKLLVHQDGETVGLALYVDPDVLDRLTAADPTEHLHSGNLSDFWIALEGVSHFLYLTWNAERDERVSLLELELQAEVDKFAATILALGEDEDDVAAEDVHTLLFSDPVFDDALDEDGLARYEQANRYAGKYCHGLQRRYLRQARHTELVRELRRFYRRPRAEKIRYIHQA